MKRFFYILILVAFAQNVFAQNSKLDQVKWGQDRGGGNTGSPKINSIIEMLGPKSKNSVDFEIKDQLKKVIGVVLAIPPTDPVGKELADDIKKMVDGGLIDDITRAKYDLESYCEEKKGVETSASTLKLDRTNRPKSPIPSICLNIPKLSRENTVHSDLLGLLMHEHARHFGREDKVKFGVQPLDLAIQKWSNHLKVAIPNFFEKDLIMRDGLVYTLGFFSKTLEKETYEVGLYTSSDTISTLNMQVHVKNNENNIGKAKLKIFNRASVDLKETYLYSLNEPIPVSIRSDLQYFIIEPVAYGKVQFSEIDVQIENGELIELRLDPKTRWLGIYRVTVMYPALTYSVE